MNEVCYKCPTYTKKIIENLKKTDWFIHSFDLGDGDDIYNLAGYLYNTEFNNLEYSIHLDLNIYQYVLSAFKKNKKKNKLHRNAIALMVFGKFINAVFDPTLAVYEKLNYLDQCPDELIDDLILFRRIDDSDMEGLAKFALGYTDDINLPDILPIDRDILKFELTKYRRLKKWDNFYLFVLKVTELYCFDKSTNEEKIDKFLKWCFSDFMYSLVAISFVLKLMGKRSLQKAMKYKRGQSIKEKQNSLFNMTWDLFLLDKFFENWVKNDQNKEFIYASNDKALKEILEMAISIQIKGDANHLVDCISPLLIREINKVNGLKKETKERGIVGAEDFKSYRDELIKKSESVVLS